MHRHKWINPLSISIALFRKRINKVKVRKVLFLDIDGTAWEDRGPGTNFTKPTLNSDLLTVVKKARKKGFRVVLVTNQTYFCYQTKIKYLVYFRYFLLLAKVNLQFGSLALLVCHHHPEANFASLRRNCSMRKPSSNMILMLRTFIPYNPTTSIFSGDRVTDVACASLGGVQKSYLIQNSRMFENNIQSSIEMPEHLIFSLITAKRPNWSSFD